MEKANQLSQAENQVDKHSLLQQQQHSSIHSWLNLTISLLLWEDSFWILQQTPPTIIREKVGQLDSSANQDEFDSLVQNNQLYERTRI